MVVAVTVALVLSHRGPHASALSADQGPGTFVTLRAHHDGLSAADLDQARRTISARAAALGAAHPDVRVAGPDEITAFLPGVAASAVGALGIVDAFQVRPFILDWILASKSPAPAPSSRIPEVVDQWKSLGFAPPKDAAAYRALSQAQQDAVRAVYNDWDCGDLPLDRADEPIVACDPRFNKYLLAATVLSSKDVQSAAVVPLGWPLAPRHSSVGVTLSDAGRQRWKAYAAHHNDDVHAFDIANEVANLLDDEVGQVYRTDAIISETGVTNDGTTQKVDAGLAANLTGGPLPAPFDVVSVRSK